MDEAGKAVAEKFRGLVVSVDDDGRIEQMLWDRFDLNPEGLAAGETLGFAALVEVTVEVAEYGGLYYRIQFENTASE